MDSVFVLEAVAQVATVTIPDVQPDFSAPFFVGIQRFVSWFLGICALLSIVAFAYCVLGIVFKGFGNQAYQEHAAANVVRVVVAVILLASASAIVGFFWGFDLGL